jgi:site-specific recombinase XerD
VSSSDVSLSNKAVKIQAKNVKRSFSNQVSSTDTGPARNVKAAGIVARGNMLSHRLRDTFAVDLLEKGVPLEEVSKLLGHESIKTTERHYSKWMKGRQDRLDSLVTATWSKKLTGD